MSQFFLDQREHAAEALFAHDEELRFLAHRRAVEALSAWASESMGLTGEASAAYEAGLVNAYVSGTSEDRILTTVQTDLERAGKSALSTTAATVLAQATAQALGELHGNTVSHERPQTRVDQQVSHSINASLSWRD